MGIGETRILAQGGVVDERGVVTGRQTLAELRLKAHGPVVRLLGALTPGVRAQVVHHVPAAEYQDALGAQRAQTCAELVMEAGRFACVDAQLHDRHLRLRIQVAQHRPAAVIQAPARSSVTGSGASSCCTRRASAGSPGAA